jgi:methionyl-tRNA synthetase
VDGLLSPEDADRAVRSADAVWLSGGPTLRQIEDIKRYGLIPALQARDGVTIGMSAGAINMARHVVLAKDESRKERLGTVLYNLIESIRIASVLLSAFLPDTAKSMQAQIGAASTDWDSIQKFGATKAGSSVGTPEPIFMRIDEKEKLKEIETLIDQKTSGTKAEKAGAEEPEPPAGPAVIGIEDFSRVELRAAKVISCERLPKSDKLLKLMLDAGEDSPRQVLSGIAKWYAPEDLIGRTVALVSNLKPVKLRGVDSNGMILAADNGEDDVRVVFLDGVHPGAKIR